MSYCFQCTGILPPWLSLFMDILFLFSNCKWNCFLNFSHYHFISHPLTSHPWASHQFRFQSLQFMNCSYMPMCVCSVTSIMSDSLQPYGCSPPVSSVHAIVQARLLEWLLCPPPEGLPDPGIKPTPPAPPASQVDFLLLNHWGRCLICTVNAFYVSLIQWF